MKTNLILTFGLFLGIISCKKEIDTDYRDVVIGNYSGIRVDTRWIDFVIGYGHDTTNVVLSLTKSELDSVIDIGFNPPYSYENFSFKYLKGQFISTTYYHPPKLKLKNDSLYFRHQGGLGPIWTECFCRKLKLY